LRGERFDENFKGNALWEEIDCAFRIRKAGWKIWYCADARVSISGTTGAVAAKAGPYAYCTDNSQYGILCRQACPVKYYASWFNFGNTALEYLSRIKIIWLMHDPMMV